MKICECGCGQVIENPRPCQKYRSASCSVRATKARKKVVDDRNKKMGIKPVVKRSKHNTTCPRCRIQHYARGAGKWYYCRPCRVSLESQDLFYA